MDNTGVYAVIDTCVLVSALRSKLGASFAILQAIRRGDIRIALSVALAIEYESVALRPGLVSALTTKEIGIVVDVLCKLAHPQKIFYTWGPFCPIRTTILSSSWRQQRDALTSSPTTSMISRGPSLGDSDNYTSSST